MMEATRIMTDDEKRTLMITVPFEKYDYFMQNEWKIRAYDGLLIALDRNRTSLIVDSEGKMEIVTSSDNWGIHWLGVER